MKEEAFGTAMTLIDMLRQNARNFPEKAAIVYRDRTISYHEMAEIVAQVANGLRDLGIQQGDRVALMLPRIPELVLGFLGSVMAGAMVAPVSFELLDKDIQAILSHLSASCLIVHKRHLALARRSIPPDCNIFLLVVDGQDEEREISWAAMLRGRKPDELPMKLDNNDFAYINYTSGSTGASKGALTTHSNIWSNTVAAVDAFQMTPDDIHLCIFAPFAHPHEIFARPLYLGGTIVLVDTIYPKSVLEAIACHGVTCIMGLAPMYQNLLEVLDHKSYDLSSLRVLESGGMYTRIDLIQKYRQRLGIPILPVWGATETTGIAIASHFDDETPLGSVGRPCSSYEIKVIDEQKREVPPCEVGECILRGPGVVQGYYRDALSTNNCFDDGWYYSGDLVKRDEQNCFYIVDRKTGMMKVAGLKVYPSEIEAILMEHPEIKEVAVIAVKQKLRGEVPKAIIVARNEQVLTEKEVLLFCKARMPNYRIPRIIEFRKDLPKIGSGKINKKELLKEEM
jgi:long-chain acyl-CoA synthetase